MNDSKLAQMPASSDLIDVRSEQIRLLYAAIPGSLVAILICSLVLCYTLWPVAEHTTLGAWLVITNLLSALRLLMYREFKRREQQRVVSEHWYRRAVITSIASGLTWGAAGFFLFNEQSLVHQIFLGFVITGMCAGAITTLSAIIEAARGFVIFAIAPIIIKCSLASGEYSLALTVLSLLFVVMILLSAQRINQTIVESLQVRYQRELAEQTIRHQAHYDELTNLPNRRLLLSTLRQEMAKAARHHRSGAVFFIDLDRFKAINDSLGHAIGDALLVKAAQRIGARLRKEDCVARFGGDEFVVLLPEVGSDHETAGNHATRIADQIRQLFTQPFVIMGHDIHMTISIGIAMFPAEVPAEDLIKYADVAMYRAKKDGRDSVRLFSAEMQEAVNLQRQIEKGLRQALENDEFELYFQAQYDPAETIVGAEALLRWNHPQRGLIVPGEFIEVAEQTGLIVPIGDWVLRSACEHLAKLDAEMVLSVNLSPRQFSDINFTNQLKRIMLETRIDPRNLRLEITESLAMIDIEHTINTMGVLRRLGASFSVDDFGTGYSSLSYLNRLPVDELKIDQSFVRDISSASAHAVIVDTIIAMSQQLGLEVVAEGIETDTELAYFKARACDRYQGNYFSKPQPFAKLAAALKPA